jgi:hypothetical protein
VHKESIEGGGERERDVTREYESHQVGKELSSIIEEDQEEVHESNAKRNEHL